MKNTLETRLGLFFAMALIVAFILLEILGGRDFFRPGTQVRAQFANIQELKAGDQVKMAGVQIGRVEQIDLADGKVEVVMKLNKNAQVHTDSVATIKFVGLMGQNYISIDFGTQKAPLVAAGALLQSKEQPDLSALMARLDNVAGGVEGLTKNFSGESFGNLLGPFTDFLKENSPKLSVILGNVQTVSSQIAKGEGTIGKLVSDDRLYNSALDTVNNLNKTTTDIKPMFERAQLTLDNANNIIAEVNQGKGTLGKLVKDEALYKETTSAMTNLKEILEKINQGKGSVGVLVNDDSFIKNAKLTLQKVDKATEGLEDTGPLSLLGTLANSLF